MASRLEDLLAQGQQHGRPDSRPDYKVKPVTVGKRRPAPGWVTITEGKENVDWTLSNEGRRSKVEEGRKTEVDWWRGRYL